MKRALAVLLFAAWSCSAPVSPDDAGQPDAGAPDAGAVDSGTPDAGTSDAGTPDAGTLDSGTPDSGIADAGEPDAGSPDAGEPDAGAPDAGPPDAGEPDAGEPDAGTADAGCPTQHTCAMIGANCGTQADGCGGSMDCGHCANGTACNVGTICPGTEACTGPCPGTQTCGGGGVQNTCGMPACVSMSCIQQNKDCGSINDGCNNILNCGPCLLPGRMCGLFVPNKCSLPDGGA